MVLNSLLRGELVPSQEISRYLSDWIVAIKSLRKVSFDMNRLRRGKLVTEDLDWFADFDIHLVRALFSFFH